MREVHVELTLETYRQFFLRESGGAWHLVMAQGHDHIFVEKLRAVRDELYGRLLQARDIAVDGAGAGPMNVWPSRARNEVCERRRGQGCLEGKLYSGCFLAS